MALISEAEASAIRADLAVLYVHTYTRTQTVVEGEDAWGNVVYVPGATVAGLPCAYAVDNALLRSGAGRTVLAAMPMLTVPTSDPLTLGDTVRDIRDPAGGVLLAGPLKVESVDPVAALGPSLQKRARLAGADVPPNA